MRSAEGSTFTFVVELPQVYPQPKMCPACSKVHANKAIHLRLDANGDVIVSPEVYGKLLGVHLAGFELANEVKDPPPLFLGAVAKDKERIVEIPLNAQVQEQIAPGRTQYESRDLIQAPYAPIIEARQDKQERKVWKRKRQKQRIYPL